MRSRGWFAGIAVVMLLVTSAQAGSSVPTWTKRLASSDEDVRDNALLEHRKRRSAEIKELLTIVAVPVKKGETFYLGSPRNSAIRALGNMRATEACDELVKWVIPHPGQSLAQTSLAEGNPAQLALAAIGLPAVPALTKALLKAKKKEHALEFARTVEMIKGRVDATAYFQRLLIAAKNDSERKNVRTALDFCEQLRKYEQKIKAEQEELSRKK